MLDRITADGNTIIFDNTEIRCNELPRKAAWKLMERFRIILLKGDFDINAMMAGVVQRRMSQVEMVQYLLDFIGTLDEELVDKVQSQLFDRCEYRKLKSGSQAYTPLNDMTEEVGLEDLSPFDLYILMGRCIWVNYKKDIQRAIAALEQQNQAQQEPQEEATEETQPESPETGEPQEE